MYVFFAWLAFIWFFILFCDTIFKTCMFHPYFRALHFTGLDIKPLILHWKVTRYNRFLNRVGLWRPTFLKHWFNIGAFITCLIAVPSLLLYAATFIRIVYSNTLEEYESAILQPVIPGINFPTSRTLLYCCIILICSVVHEFGHAVAASREGISIENWGFAVCLVFPVAFVCLRFDQFLSISRWQQMRILCAGIWHNIILSILAFLSVSVFLTLISSQFYLGNGVSVYKIEESSVLNNPFGFAVGDHIYKVGNCSAKSGDMWLNCLNQLKEKPQGLCVPKAYMVENSSSVNFQKCINSLGNLYFQTEDLKNPKAVCMYARTAVRDFNLCDETPDCEESFLCSFPHLPRSHKFIVIERHEKPAVLYEGPIHELIRDVKVSNYVPKSSSFPSSIPEFAQEIMEYIIMFSSGLAVLNVLPIFSLDGQFIIENLIHMYLPYWLPRYDQRKFIFVCISRFSLAIVIVASMVSAYKFYLFYF